MSEPRHPLHSLCSYLGCFPPSVPRKLIETLVPEGKLVLDPFCGSGTTVFEALRSARPAIGVDLNPLAVAITKAKIQRVSESDVNHRVMDLARSYSGTADIEQVPDDIRIIFHPRTLAQLVYLREHLEEGRPEDIFIRGVVLGMMHGKVRKDGETSYLSIDMPNTFSMSPDYVRKFVKRNRLKQIPADVFGKLRQRVSWLLRDGALPPKPSARIALGDATHLEEVLRKLSVPRVDAIITSPPYLGVLRYGAFNWIRLWFIHLEPRQVDQALDGTDSLDKYLSFMSSFLLSASTVLRNGSCVALVIGDVVEGAIHLELAKRVWEELHGTVPFRLRKIALDRFDESVKTTRIWGEGKKGRATPLDRVLILEKDDSATRIRSRKGQRATNALDPARLR
jgi:DNA modification methylase